MMCDLPVDSDRRIVQRSKTRPISNFKGLLME